MPAVAAPDLIFHPEFIALALAAPFIVLPLAARWLPLSSFARPIIVLCHPPRIAAVVASCCPPCQSTIHHTTPLDIVQCCLPCSAARLQCYFVLGRHSVLSTSTTCHRASMAGFGHPFSALPYCFDIAFHHACLLSYHPSTQCLVVRSLYFFL